MSTRMLQRKSGRLTNGWRSRIGYWKWRNKNGKQEYRTGIIRRWNLKVMDGSTRILTDTQHQMPPCSSEKSQLMKSNWYIYWKDCKNIKKLSWTALHDTRRKNGLWSWCSVYLMMTSSSLDFVDSVGHCARKTPDHSILWFPLNSRSNQIIAVWVRSQSPVGFCLGQN